MPFCVGLGRVSEITVKTGLRFMRGATDSPLVYMQAIKLNDKRIYSNDTGEPFGVEKWDWVEENGGRIIGAEGLELSDGQITDCRLDSYRNLGT